MINEWVRNHKKLAVLISVGAVALLGLVIWLLVGLSQGNKSTEETEMTASVSVTNLNILYDHFSDYTIGYIFNAMNAALVKNASMKNGSIASENVVVASDNTNDDVYPSMNDGNYTLTIKDGAISYFEDSWGMWKTFTVSVNDGRSFKIDVAIGAHNRINDVGYTPMTITKL